MRQIIHCKIILILFPFCSGLVLTRRYALTVIPRQPKMVLNHISNYIGKSQASTYFRSSHYINPHLFHTSTSIFSVIGRDSFRSRNRRISTNIDPIENKLLETEELARQKRIGQRKQRIEKAVRRENRIAVLEDKLKKSKVSTKESESCDVITKNELEELKGLLNVREKFEETYDPLMFTKEHMQFKAMHNDAFVQLSKYCQKERNCLSSSNEINVTASKEKLINVFFLDGPDGGTANALIHGGNFVPSQCYVANRHLTTCESLRISGGGLLPDKNVAYATASEALTLGCKCATEDLFKQEIDVKEETVDGEEEGAFARIDFAAYYFDGCGGFVPHIVGMLCAALLRPDFKPSYPIAVGYSILGGSKEMISKELAISQALNVIARKIGMKMIHVLDDPMRFGIASDIQKIGGVGGSGTFTTWLLLQPLEYRDRNGTIY